jgi:hypothetical protein
VCSFCEAMVGSLSVVSTAVLSARVAVVDSSEVGRSAVYKKYNNDPRTLPWGTPALIWEQTTNLSQCICPPLFCSGVTLQFTNFIFSSFLFHTMLTLVLATQTVANLHAGSQVLCHNFLRFFFCLNRRPRPFGS